MATVYTRLGYFVLLQPEYLHVRSVALPVCALIFAINVRAPGLVLPRMSSMIDLIISAFATHISLTVGPLPIHLSTLSSAVLLSLRYSRSISSGVTCSVRATAPSSSLNELIPASLPPHRPLNVFPVSGDTHFLLQCLSCEQIHPQPMFLLEIRSIPCDLRPSRAKIVVLILRFYSQIVLLSLF